MYQVEKVLKASKPDAIYRTVEKGCYPQIQGAAQRFRKERMRLDVDEAIRVVEVEGDRCRTLFTSVKEASA